MSHNQYLVWNQLIIDYFFNEAVAGRRIYLDLDVTVVSAIEEAHPEISSFVETVRNEIYINNTFTLKNIMAYLTEWKRGDQLKAPPTVAFLAALVYAANEMHLSEEYTHRAFYPRFVQSILQTESPNAGTDQMSHLRTALSNNAPRWDEWWFGLEHWLTDRDNNENSIGKIALTLTDSNTPYVTRISGQALLDHGDEDLFEGLFLSEGFDSETEVTDNFMAEMVDEWLQNDLLPAKFEYIVQEEWGRYAIAEAANICLSNWQASFGLVSYTEANQSADTADLKPSRRANTRTAGLVKLLLRSSKNALGIEQTFLELCRVNHENTARQVTFVCERHQTDGDVSRFNIDVDRSVFTNDWLETRSGWSWADHRDTESIKLTALNMPGSQVWQWTRDTKPILLQFDETLHAYLETKLPKKDVSSLYIVMAEDHKKKPDTCSSKIWDQLTWKSPNANIQVSEIFKMEKQIPNRPIIRLFDGKRLQSSDIFHAAFPPKIRIDGVFSQGKLQVFDSARNLVFDQIVQSSEAEPQDYVIPKIDEIGRVSINFTETSGENQTTSKNFVSIRADSDNATRDWEYGYTDKIDMRSFEVVPFATADRFASGALVKSSSMAKVSLAAARKPIRESVTICRSGEVRQWAFSDYEQLPNSADIRLKQLWEIEPPVCPDCGSVIVIERYIIAPGVKGGVASGFKGYCLASPKAPKTKEANSTMSRVNHFEIFGDDLEEIVELPTSERLVVANQFDHDGFIDCLTYWGSGGSGQIIDNFLMSIGGFTRAEAQEYLEKLESIAVIELERRQDGTPTYQWAVPSTTLYPRADGYRLLLAGGRTGDQLDTIAKIANGRDIHILKTQSESGIRVIEYASQDKKSLSGFAAEVTAQLDTIHYQDTPPSSQLLGLLSDLDNVIENLPELPAQSGITPGSGAWDPENTRWTSWSNRFTFYRLRKNPWEYAQRLSENGEDSWRKIEVRLGKYLALRDFNRSTIAISYDESQSILQVNLDLRLPWLFERVLALCSGFPPEKVKRNRFTDHRYREIPGELVQQLESQLGITFARRNLS